MTEAQQRPNKQPGFDPPIWRIYMSFFHELTMNDIHGNPVEFARYRGQTCLIVNVASR
jgi:Glutathione peroxidase